MTKDDRFTILNTNDSSTVCMMNVSTVDDGYAKEHLNELNSWDSHDWKTVIGFKNQESWQRFCTALQYLASFYSTMYKHDVCEKFHIFFKSYNGDQLLELKRDCPKKFFNSIIDDITTFCDQGYVFMYLTTQRECHDKNQFLMYMMDNFMYDRGVVGHVNWDICTDNDEIQIIALNEKW